VRVGMGAFYDITSTGRCQPPIPLTPQLRYLKGIFNACRFRRIADIQPSVVVGHLADLR
jgi:hypothetical protein